MYGKSLFLATDITLQLRPIGMSFAHVSKTGRSENSVPSRKDGAETKKNSICLRAVCLCLVAGTTNIQAPVDVASALF